MEKENRLLHEEVQKQDRLKAVALFASGMAHEIKNPLAAIRTFAEYLPKKHNDPAFREKFATVVVGEVDRINAIVQQLLDFSRPQPPKLETINLVELLNETLEPLNSALVKNRIHATKDYPEAIPVLGDRNQLKQVFLNLFLNAIQSMPESGQLTVNAHVSQDSKAVVSIQDSGLGIPDNALPHIFEPFYTTKETGTGLGLSIVKEIVEAHGGKIGVESSAGLGTKFTLSLLSR